MGSKRASRMLKTLATIVTELTCATAVGAMCSGRVHDGFVGRWSTNMIGELREHFISIDRSYLPTPWEERGC